VSGPEVAAPRNLLRDLSAPPRVPSMVPPNAYRVGTDLAVTSGSVVLRTPMLEVIQYRPQTETVREVPLLIIPPTINKYYVLDLAPGRSLIEYLVQRGQQVFVVSWRNPDVRHREWGFDAYAQGLLDAFDTVDKITGVDAAHVVAACSGGLLACLTAAYRAAAGRIDRLASLSPVVTMIDQDRAGLASALIDEKLAARAVAQSARKGYLDGRSLAEVFAWLRPGDLMWQVTSEVRKMTDPTADLTTDPIADPTTTALAEGIALSLGTDYFLMREQLSGDEAALLDKVRAFGELEILPLANDYWERGEFPFELVPKLRDLAIVGDGMRGYGTVPMTAVGQGLVSYELGRLDGSVGTFLGVHVGLAMKSIYLLGSPEQRERWLPPDGRAGDDRRVRADRARARLGRGLAGDDRAPRR
jgi:Poly-beta-hydroxybutyrate polymerase (PhaC) N-terminus/Acyl-CoA dehydrogenase, N-terminal domain